MLLERQSQECEDSQALGAPRGRRRFIFKALCFSASFNLVKSSVISIWVAAIRLLLFFLSTARTSVWSPRPHPWPSQPNVIPTRSEGSGGRSERRTPSGLGRRSRGVTGRHAGKTFAKDRAAPTRRRPGQAEPTRCYNKAGGRKRECVTPPSACRLLFSPDCRHKLDLRFFLQLLKAPSRTRQYTGRCVRTTSAVGSLLFAVHPEVK